MQLESEKGKGRGALGGACLGDMKSDLQATMVSHCIVCLQMFLSRAEEDRTHRGPRQALCQLPNEFSKLASPALAGRDVFPSSSELGDSFPLAAVSTFSLLFKY